MKGEELYGPSERALLLALERLAARKADSGKKAFVCLNHHFGGRQWGLSANQGGLFPARYGERGIDFLSSSFS